MEIAELLFNENLKNTSSSRAQFTRGNLSLDFRSSTTSSQSFNSVLKNKLGAKDPTIQRTQIREKTVPSKTAFSVGQDESIQSPEPENNSLRELQDNNFGIGSNTPFNGEKSQSPENLDYITNEVKGLNESDQNFLEEVKDGNVDLSKKRSLNRLKEIIKEAQKSEDRRVKKELMKYFKDLFSQDGFLEKSLQSNNPGDLKKLAENLKELMGKFKEQIKSVSNELSQGIEESIKNVLEKLGISLDDVAANGGENKKFQNLLEKGTDLLQKLLDQENISQEKKQEILKSLRKLDIEGMKGQEQFRELIQKSQQFLESLKNGGAIGESQKKNIRKSINELVQKLGLGDQSSTGNGSEETNLGRLEKLLDQNSKLLQSLKEDTGQSNLKNTIKTAVQELRELLNSFNTSSSNGNDSNQDSIFKAQFASAMQEINKKLDLEEIKKKLRKITDGYRKEVNSSQTNQSKERKTLARALQNKINAMEAQKGDESSNQKSNSVDLLSGKQKNNPNSDKATNSSTENKLANFEANSAKSVSATESSDNSFSNKSGQKNSQSNFLKQAQPGAPSYRSKSSERARRIVNQVVERAQTTIDNGKQSMQLQLQPEALGEVKMEVTLESNNLSAQFKVENKSVKNTLNSNVEQLKQSLQQMGLEIDDVDVSDMKSDAEEQSEDWFDDEGQFADFNRDDNKVNTEPEQPETGNGNRNLRHYSNIEVVA